MILFIIHLYKSHKSSIVLLLSDFNVPGSAGPRRGSTGAGFALMGHMVLLVDLLGASQQPELSGITTTSTVQWQS